MRSSIATRGDRRISLNSFLISLSLNVILFIILSLSREHSVPQARDALDVDFVSLPRTRLSRRSIALPPKQIALSDRANVDPNISAMKPIPFTREIASPQPNSALSMSVDTVSPVPDIPTTIAPRSRSASSVLNPAGAWKRGDIISSGKTRQAGGQISGFGQRIIPRQPMAMITGMGDKLKGYYNISLVRYEDTSDVISTDALTQLASAMNRWTQVKTKIIKKPMMLDDPELFRVPMIYIASRRAFAFSERERENLRKYFASGGFLLFSNSAESETEVSGVANSIEFELWKVLGDAANDLADIGEKHQLYDSFFNLTKLSGLRGVTVDGRINVIYEASGYGAAWVAGTDTKRKPYMKLGVNIIAYALTTSPVVQHD